MSWTISGRWGGEVALLSGDQVNALDETSRVRESLGTNYTIDLTAELHRKCCNTVSAAHTQFADRFS